MPKEELIAILNKMEECPIQHDPIAAHEYGKAHIPRVVFIPPELLTKFRKAIEKLA